MAARALRAGKRGSAFLGFWLRKYLSGQTGEDVGSRQGRLDRLLSTRKLRQRFDAFRRGGARQSGMVKYGLDTAKRATGRNVPKRDTTSGG